MVELVKKIDVNKDTQINVSEIQKALDEGFLDNKKNIQDVVKILQTKKLNLQNVEYNIDSTFKEMIDRSKSKYTKEYDTFITNKQKEYTEKSAGERKDYLAYDSILRAISKYAQELQKENNDLLKKHGFYEKTDIVDRNGIRSTGEIYGGWEYFACSKFFEFLQKNQYPGYEKDQELITHYNDDIQKLFKNTGYDKDNTFTEDTKIYKNYSTELERESQRLKYADSIKYLSKHNEPEDPTQVEEYMKHVNSVMAYSTTYDVITKKYGTKKIAGYENILKKINGIQKKYPGFTDTMVRVSKYNDALESKKKALNLNSKSIVKYTNYVHAVQSSGLNERHKRLGILEKKLQDEISGSSENTHIFSHVKKSLAEQKKSQEETDKIRSYIKAVSPTSYFLSNFLAGAWNGANDAVLGIATGLGILLMSAYKNESELKTQIDRKDQWIDFLKIGQSTQQKQAPIKNGKFNLNFDNTVAQLGSQTTNMLILLSGAGVIGKSLTKGGAKLGVQLSQTVANKSGLVTYAMTQGLGSSFGEGLKSGLSKSEAWSYALAQSVVSSSLELIAPNQMFFGTANILGSLKIGNILKNLSSPQAKGLIIKQFVKNILKESGEEIVQENVQLVAERGINLISNNVYDTLMEDNISLADLTTTAVLTGLTTGLVSSKGSYTMAKMANNNEYTKRWIVSDEDRLITFTNKLHEVIRGKIDIGISPDQAKLLLKDFMSIGLSLDLAHQAIKNQKEGVKTKKEKEDIARREGDMSKKEMKQTQQELVKKVMDRTDNALEGYVPDTKKIYFEKYNSNIEEKDAQQKSEIYPATIQKNSQLNDTDRLIEASKLLDGEKFTEAQKKAILDAHNLPGKLHDLGFGEIRAKMEKLLDANFSKGQIRVLMDNGICGSEVTNSLVLDVNQKNILEIFKLIPELENIGSQEQYQEYLKTIFPESRLRDIVWHGSGAKFDTFIPTENITMGKGIYFTSSSEHAKGFAENSFKHTKQHIEEAKKLGIEVGEFVYPVILNFKNPQYVKPNLDIDQSINYDGLIWDGNIQGTEYVALDPTQIHILGSKTDVEGFREFVGKGKNIGEIFKINPELEKIGSQEQYEKYLKSIFPESKVKDIVYHGSNYKFDEFSKIELGKTTGSESSLEGFFFADNIDAAKHYAHRERILTAYDRIKLLHGNEFLKLKKLEKALNALKDKYSKVEKNTPNFSVKEKLLDYVHKIFKGQSNIEKQIELINQQKNQLNTEIENLESTVSSLKMNRNDLREKLVIAKKIYNDLGVDESIYETEDHYLYNIDKYNKAYEEIRKLFSIPEYGNYVYPILLNIQNPGIHNDKGTSKSFFFGDTIKQDKNKGTDSTIIKNTLDPRPLDLYVVFDPTQIHILGSKNDIEGFREFVGNDKEQSSIQKNFQLNDTDRLKEASRLLDGLEFTENQKKAILDAHNLPGVLFNLSFGEIRGKMEKLLDADFDKGQIKLLMDNGICGSEKAANSIEFVEKKQDIEDIINTTEKNETDKISFLKKTVDVLINLFKGKDIKKLLTGARSLDKQKFKEYTIEYKDGQANQFLLKFKDGNKTVGSFVAFIYEEKNTTNLQIQKVEIEDDYKGKGIMKNFYLALYAHLKTEYNNFNNFSSDYIFTKNEKTGVYDGFNMRETLVKNGLAERTGIDSDYIIPQDKPKMWRLKGQYRLIDKTKINIKEKYSTSPDHFILPLKDDICEYSKDDGSEITVAEGKECFWNGLDVVGKLFEDKNRALLSSGASFLNSKKYTRFPGDIDVATDVNAFRDIVINEQTNGKTKLQDAIENGRIQEVRFTTVDDKTQNYSMEQIEFLYNIDTLIETGNIRVEGKIKSKDGVMIDVEFFPEPLGYGLIFPGTKRTEGKISSYAHPNSKTKTTLNVVNEELAIMSYMINLGHEFKLNSLEILSVKDINAASLKDHIRINTFFQYLSGIDIKKPADILNWIDKTIADYAKHPGENIKVDGQEDITGSRYLKTGLEGLKEFKPFIKDIIDDHAKKIFVTGDVLATSPSETFNTYHDRSVQIKKSIVNLYNNFDKNNIQAFKDIRNHYATHAAKRENAKLMDEHFAIYYDMYIVQKKYITILEDKYVEAGVSIE